MDAVVPVLDLIAAVCDRRVRLPLLGFSTLSWLATGKGSDLVSTGGAALVAVAVRGRRVRGRFLGFSPALWSAASVGVASPPAECAIAVRDRRVRRGRCSFSILTSSLADNTVISASRWVWASLVLPLRAR